MTLPNVFKMNKLFIQFLPEFHASTGENSTFGMVGSWAWEEETRGLLVWNSTVQHFVVVKCTLCCINIFDIEWNVKDITLAVHSSLTILLTVWLNSVNGVIHYFTLRCLLFSAISKRDTTGQMRSGVKQGSILIVNCKMLFHWKLFSLWSTKE